MPSLGADLDVHNEADAGFFTVTTDPRVTRVGRLIRAVYADELPQLLNVLRGEMGPVGPRPLDAPLKEMAKKDGLPIRLPDLDILPVHVR